MANPITPEEIASKVNESSDQIKQSTNEVGEEFVNAFTKAANAVSPALRALDNLISQNAAIRLSVLGVSSAYDKFSTDLQKSTGFMTLSDQFKNIDDQLKGLNNTAAASALRAMLPKEMQSQADQAKSSSSSIQAYIGTLKRMVEGVMEASDQHSLLREQMLMTAGQFGSMENLRNLTNDFKSLEEYVSRTDAQLALIGAKAGIDKTKIAEYYKELSKIPGAFQLTYSSSQFAREGSHNLLEGLVSLSRGAKVPMDTLMSGVKQLRDEFNLKTTGEGAEGSGQKIIETFSLISESTEKLGVDYSVLSKDITETTAKFKYFGDNTIGVTRSIYDMAKGFEAVGMSATNAAKLSEGFVSKLSDLTIAQKAFFSGLTGGPGGAMGAAQIDLLLKEGKVDQVMKMARETIKSQLGEIVTTEEAATSQEAAGRRLLQIKQLQALGLGAQGGAQGEREAGVQLDLLREMEKPGARSTAALGTSEDIANKFLQRGEEDRKRADTPIKAMLTHVDVIRSDVNRIAFNTSQYFLGGKAPTRREDTVIPGLTAGGDIMQPIRDLMMERNLKVSGLIRDQQTFIGKPDSSGPTVPLSMGLDVMKVGEALGKSIHLAYEQAIKSKTTGQETEAMLSKLKLLEAEKDSSAAGKMRYEIGTAGILKEGIKSTEALDKFIKEHMQSIKTTTAPKPITTPITLPTTSSAQTTATREMRADMGEGSSLVMPVNSGVICAVCHEKLHNLYVKVARMTSPIGH